MEHDVNLNTGGGLDEIYQSVGIKFAFCGVEKKPKTKKMGITQLHPWAKCRDFLGDALFATHHKCSYNIYGFKFDGTATPVPTNLTYLLIQHTSKEDLERNLRVLHHYEKKVRWKRSKLIDLSIKDGDSSVFLLVSSKKWVSSTALISLYTLLWRLAGVKEGNQAGIKEGETVDTFIERCSVLGGNDSNYLRKIKYLINFAKLNKHPFYTVMRHNRAIFKDSYAHVSTDIPHGVHGSNGILTLIQAAIPTHPNVAVYGTYANQTARNLASFIKKAE